MVNLPKGFLKCLKQDDIIIIWIYIYFIAINIPVQGFLALLCQIAEGFNINAIKQDVYP